VVEQVTTNRKSFLRQIGVTLGAAFGALAIPAVARAAQNQCCPTNHSVCPECPPNSVPYWCDCSPHLPSYCQCRPSDTGCDPAPC
jgi:hypothetical protein